MPRRWIQLLGPLSILLILNVLLHPLIFRRISERWFLVNIGQLLLAIALGIAAGFLGSRWWFVTAGLALISLGIAIAGLAV